jgi:hypothetical protein
MNISTLMIVAALCLAIGYVAGLLVSSLLGGHSKPEDESAKPDINAGLSALAEPAPANAGSGISGPISISGQKALSIDQILFWRDRPGGTYQIDLDGETLGNTGSLTADQRQRLVFILPEIKSWLEKLAAKTGVEIPKEPAVSVINLPVPKKGPVRLDLNPKPPLPQAPKSIVTQIDDILQTQISGTSLAGRGVRLAEAPGQRVVVWIGLENYPGINAVPDAEVLTAIRHAVKTWEASA